MSGSRLGIRRCCSGIADLIRLRRTTPCLNDGEPGNVRVAFDQRDKWLRMVRGEIEVICNLGRARRSFEVPGENELLLASRQDVTLKDGAIVLAPDTVAVLRVCPSRG